MSSRNSQLALAKTAAKDVIDALTIGDHFGSRSSSAAQICEGALAQVTPSAGDRGEQGYHEG